MQEFIANEIPIASPLFALFSYWPSPSIPNFPPKDIIRPAIFSKYPISETQLITFKNSKNCALLCTINVKGKYIRIFNNHLQTTDLTQIKEKGNDIAHKEFYNQLRIQALQRNSLIRAQQADNIRSLVQQSPYPVIMCGDFNDSPFSYTYKAMLGNLKDGFITNGKGYASSYRYASKMFRIDYIFYSEPLKGTNYYTSEFGESDHYPVILELKI